MRQRRIATGVATLLCLTALPPVVSSTVASAATPAPAAVPAAVSAATVTLLTGDQVEVLRFADGRQAATIQPGPGREGIGFSQQEVDGHLTVLPSDAVPYVASHKLDRDLFDLTELIAQGYDDAHRATLPLIVSYRRGATLRRTFSAAATGKTLESIGAQAVEADRSAAFWESVDDDRPGIATPVLASGIDRIRLDRKVKANLERSVPQIGAPAAWQAGYDGAGVSVAVLDTGVDTGHPDLAGVVTETRNFTPSPDTSDHFGHGTHVSSIVAGRGTGSTPARKGVAPGAHLLVGKVLADDGFGQESWIVDGMEWAASSGAKVVNMSLGGGPTDGIDALSQAVDTLTASTGTLFVVSAGNDGQYGEFTVGTPGSANSALTVGAVDRDESLAPFSSRGPRLRDFAIKPDVTAPGVGIVAARAAGTSMGSPVDDHYTAASGTSMAAPHVAGAAALLAQQHPDWSAVQLKDALASTALHNAGLTVYQQGGGRIDLARAVVQPVIGTATLDLGLFTDRDTATVTKPVTYTNTSGAPATLALRLDTAATAMSLSAASITVPAHGTATVDVVVDPAKLARGRYGGYLEATAGDTVVHTSLGASKEAPLHTVTFTGIGPDGGPAFVNPLTFWGADSRYDVLTYLREGSTVKAVVAEGNYYLHAVVGTGRAPDEADYVVTDPQVKVDRDLTVTVDARKANRVTIKTPQQAQQRGILSFYTHREFGGRRITNTQMEFDGTRYLSVTPTARTTDGAFEFGSRWSLVKPMLTTSVRGSSFEPELFYLGKSPAIDGDRQYRVVDAGLGTPESYTGKDVRGKIVLVHGATLSESVLVTNAAAAGAAMTVVIPDPEDYAWTVYLPTGTRMPIPAARIRQSEGARLLSMAARGPVTLRLSGTPVSPFLYDVHQVIEQQIPRNPAYVVGPRNSATVTTDYHDNGGIAVAKEQRFSWRPWQTTSNLQYQRWMPTAQTRQEIVSAGDITWMHRVKYYHSLESLNPLSGGMIQQPVQYRSGQHLRESWFAPVARPAVPHGVSGAAPYRRGDTMTIQIPAWADAETGHYGLPEGGLGEPTDKGTARLYRDGTLVASGKFAWGTFPAGAEPATYRLEQDVTRTTPEWQFAPQTRTAWTFRSERADGDNVLPLLQADYAVDTDLTNRTPANRSQTLGLSVRYPDGLPAPRIDSVGVEVSYDDGASWRAVRVQPRSGRYDVRLDHPRLADTSGTVSLRIHVTDRQGGVLDQTILKAFGLR